jgi:hypothetical protein
MQSNQFLRFVAFAQISGEMRNGARAQHPAAAYAHGRSSPAAFWSLELAEKINNYLNI